MFMTLSALIYLNQHKNEDIIKNLCLNLYQLSINEFVDELYKYNEY